MPDQPKNPAEVSTPDSSERTKAIPIVDASKSTEATTFSLGPIQPSQTAPPEVAPNPNRPVFPDTKITHAAPLSNSGNRSAKLTFKIWSALEFIAVTAAIFIVMFLALNWQSYSQLFQTKLDLLKGTVNSNPYIAQQVKNFKNASPEGQKPLPIVKNTEAAKKQMPDLNLEIAPPDERVIIPRIGQNVPVIQVPTDKLIQKDWAALEGQIQDALRYGVVHFPGTAFPGQNGNVVITGHSSYFPWDPGRFKDVFALLHQVNVGDEVIVYHAQEKFRYIVYEKKVVKPSQVDVLTQEGEDRLTLITCTPVGTVLNRLIVLARPKTT